MGIASLILGIITIIVSFIPFCNFIAFMPAGIGLALGIIEITRKDKVKKTKGMAIAGIVLSSIAMVIIAIWFVITAIFGGMLEAYTQEEYQHFYEEPYWLD